MSTATATLTTTSPVPATAETAERTGAHPVRRATLRSGLVAAGATTALAAAAGAAGVPFEIDGEAIPVLGFAQLTLVGAVIGGLMAAALNRWTTRSRRWFMAATVMLTALSCLPSVALPPDAATKIVLVATHVVAALIIVPVLAAQTRR
jgi:hypothetical protein